jgi:uncharacterized protein involved in exopolysaccharide biosynthesis
MLDYGQTVAQAPRAIVAPRGPMKFNLAALSDAASLFARNTALILAIAAACAIGGFAVSKLLTPRYVASAQIYIDPHNLPGVDKQDTPEGGDSNGFINFVETQSLVITSRIVLARVVANEKLDRDDEFVGGPSLWRIFGSASQTEPGDERVNAAIAALASRISVRRPERTFVIDLSVRSRDPEKAARLANAVANAFIEVQSAMRSDSARQTTTSLSGRLETLRGQLMAAEKRVEDFKAQNGLVGTREQTVTEQQLRDMNQQITVARTQVEEARSHADQIQAARSRGGDVGAIAAGLNLASLAPLRAQQAEAQQKLADLSAELGPKHPLVKDAAARVAEANRAVEAELARYAQSVRNDYARARELEASLTRQLESLKQQALANDQTSVGLRDLQREADAARNVYDLFVTRSRQTGDIQQVDANALNMRVISMATAPRDRSFPPSSSLLAGAGFMVGLAAGFGAAILRERRALNPVAKASPQPLPERALGPIDPKMKPVAAEKPAKADLAPRGAASTWTSSAGEPAVIAITERSELDRHQSRQSPENLDLACLGFAVIGPSSDNAEFREVLDAFGLFERLNEPVGDRLCLGVAGDNESGLRSALAINLALTIAARGFRVALIDAASRSAKLTRAVRAVTRSHAAFFQTSDDILLVLPRGYDDNLGRMSPLEAVDYLCAAADEDIDVVVCDGPGVDDPDAEAIFATADDIVLLDADGDPQSDMLGEASRKVRAIVRFEEVAQISRKAG